ncbi:helix-turn-helix transcriptional regulator [Nocardia vinacea]|uniref:helix-turn-helix transcriptional regulator n=1 Tax=Nocardia vinacea TaxID=96468 RepID=UPI0002E1D622|nr:helix-turn-helix transcriptional regulator [Nocardia vinacea]
MLSVPDRGAFVGRAAEVAALQRAYQDESVQTVLIAGEPGLGKSRLVSEFASRLGSDVLVLTGRCPEFGVSGVPFAPFVTIMRALVRRIGIDELTALLPAARPALSRWLPELAMRTGAAEPESDRIRLFGEILTVFEQLAISHPVVLVLEDLHWADDSSRELLAFLIANLTQRDLLLIGTYRPTDSEPLRRLVTGLRRDPGVRVLNPEPLTKHEVGRQLAAVLNREPEPGVATRVFQRSKGIPLFVEALGRALQEDPDRVPADLSDLLLGYQAGLPEHARALLRLAATAGSPVRAALLESATDLSDDALHPALRQLTDQRLLLTTDTGYEFRHSLIRDAVYDDMLPVERKRLHTRLSQVLLGEDALRAGDQRMGELAYHAYAAGDLPHALVASWGAATESEGVQGERVRQLDRVLELWHRVPDAATLIGADRLTVLERIVEACFHGGIVERGVAAADEALELLDAAAAPELAARLYYYRAGLENQSSAGSVDDLTRALELLPAWPPSVLRGEVLATLAASRVFNGDADGAARDARAAVEIAEQTGTPALAARGYAYQGLAAVAGNGSAVAYFEQAHAAANDPQTLLTVVLWESAALVAAGEYQAAIEAIQQGLRAAHKTFRFADAGPILLVKWAQALAALGRWPEALGLIDESLTEQLPPLSKAALLLCHARIVLAQGSSAAATSSADAAAELLSDGPWARQYQLQLHTVRTDIAIADGRSRHAHELVAETLAADDLTTHHHEVWPLLATAARIADFASTADRLPVTTAVDTAYRAVFTATMDSDPAAWHKAVSAWRAIDQRYDLARSLLNAAEAELAVGNRAAAREPLREAAELAADLGATPLADAVAQVAERARVALQVTRPEPVNQQPRTFGLTPRELDVLRLVAQGLSNRQIAAELFISGNTAGVHVSRILTKLGAATRTEAAAVARKHGLIEPD